MSDSRGPAYAYVASDSGSFRLRFECLEDRTQPSGFAGLGAAAEFGVFALAQTDVKSNHATVDGDVGVSKGGSLNNSGHSTITGDVVGYNAGEYKGHGFVGGSVLVDPALIAQAHADALSAASQAAALTATQSFGTITQPTTVTGNGGLNVIYINGDIKASLTLSGTANDVFIINVTGSLKFNHDSVLGLAGGATAGHVLYNFTGAKGDIITHDDNVLNGTLLAPRYNVHLDGVLNGELVSGGKSIHLQSGVKVNAVPFATSAPPPAPADASLSGSVFHDFFPNGVRDPGEPAIAGVQLTLTGVDAQGNVVTRTAVTNEDGSYTFSDLPPGTYQLSETQPENFADGDETVGTVNGSQRGQRLDNDVIGGITLASGESAVGYDFAEVFVAS